jgi:hypothetical protein
MFHGEMNNMNYYILQQDPRILDHAYAMSGPPNVDPLDLIDGKILPDPGPLRLSLSPRSGKFRGAIIGGLVTLFHQRFIAELLRLGIDNFQCFPVELVNPDGGIELTYSLINVIGLLEAVNEKESAIKPRATGGRGQLYSFKIDSGKTMGQQLFRIAEAPSLIIIDESLRESLLVFNAPGILMLPTERYDGWG